MASVLSAFEQVAGGRGFHEFVEGRCAEFYAVRYGRPSLTTSIDFRFLLIGQFEGIDRHARMSSIAPGNLAMFSMRVALSTCAVALADIQLLTPRLTRTHHDSSK